MHDTSITKLKNIKTLIYISKLNSIIPSINLSGGGCTFAFLPGPLFPSSFSSLFLPISKSVLIFIQKYFDFEKNLQFHKILFLINIFVGSRACAANHYVIAVNFPYVTIFVGCRFSEQVPNDAFVKLSD